MPGMFEGLGILPEEGDTSTLLLTRWNILFIGLPFPGGSSRPEAVEVLIRLLERGEGVGPEPKLCLGLEPGVVR